MSRGLVCVALCAGCGDGVPGADAATGSEVLGELVTLQILVDEPGPPLGGSRRAHGRTERRTRSSRPAAS